MSPPSDALRADVPLGGRLHPAAIGVWSIASIGPGVFLLIAGPATAILPVLLVAGSALAGLVKYLRFTWMIDHGTLTIEQGLIQQRRRVIPLERIQSVEVVRGLRHRLFGVVELRVETVGGSAAEGKLDALDPETAARVRRVLLRQPAVVEAEEDRDVLAKVPASQIVIAGLTGGRVGVAAALVGFGLEFVGDRVERLLQLVPTDDLLRTAFIAAAVIVGAFVVSIVATVLTYWNFTLSRDGAAFRVERGLLEQRTDTIPVGRVQALWLEENIVRRLFGLAAVRVEVAGRSGGKDATVSALLLPIASRRAAVDLIATVQGDPTLAAVSLQGMPRAALRRRVARGLGVALVATVAATVWLGPAGLLVAVSALPFAALGVAAYRALGWAVSTGTVVSRSGVLVRRTAWTDVRRLQSLGLRQTPLQRWSGLATLRLHIARNRGLPGDPELVDVDADVALTQLRALAAASLNRMPGPTPAAP